MGAYGGLDEGNSGKSARKLQDHTEIVLRLRDGRTRVRSRRGGSRGSGVALRYPAPIRPVYVLRVRQSIRINVHVGTGDYGAAGVVSAANLNRLALSSDSRCRVPANRAG